MKITRVAFEKPTGYRVKPLALCSVVLDDCLMLTNIRLFRNNKGYYLVLPSKQDVYQDVVDLNKGVDLEMPDKLINPMGTQKKIYEEFFHPVGSSFYKNLLSTIVKGYYLYKANGMESYIPKD